MSNPIPGKQYIIVDGDRLSEISVRAYGTAVYWPRIYRANQTVFKSGNPDLIFPGEKISIPILQETKKLRSQIGSDGLIGKSDDDFTLSIDGREISVDSASIVLTMDSAADGCSATVAWNPGQDLDLDSRLKPFTYQPTTVHLGNELVLNGILYAPNPEMTPDGIVKNLEIWSLTADVIDSTIIRPPYEKNKIKLSIRANEIVEPVGIQCILDEAIDTDPLIDRMTAEPQETQFDHIQKYASQFGILVSNTPQGDLLLLKANKGGKPVDSLVQGFQKGTEYKARFDGRLRYNSYKALGESPGSTSKATTAKDNNVPRSRSLTFTANDSTSGSIKNAAEWKRSTELAKALTVPLPVSGWRNKNGDLWKPNTIVTVQSDVLDIPNGYNFLIRQVEFINSSDSQETILSLVPPEVYTGEPLSDPWSS